MENPEKSCMRDMRRRGKGWGKAKDLLTLHRRVGDP